MSLIDNITIGATVDLSGFNTDLKKAAQSIQDTFGVTGKQAAQIAKLETTLKREIETFGMSGRAAQLYRMQVEGIPPAALKSVQALVNQKQRLEENKKKAEEAARSWANFKSTLYAFTIGNVLSKLTSGVQSFVSSIPSLVKGTLDVVDHSGDMAGRLGMSVEELTRLQYAFKLTGSEAEDVAPALKKFNANLSDAANDTGPAAAALRALGLNAKQLKKDTPSEAIVKISDSFKQITNPADRARLAMDLFGKGGIQVLNSLDAGGASLKKFMAESDALGNTVSGDMAEIAGAANDAQDRMWAAFGGLGKSLSVAVAPAIISVTGAITEFSKSITSGGASAAGSVNGLYSSWQKLDVLIGTTKAAWYLLQAAINQTLGRLAQGVGFLSKMGDTIGGAFGLGKTGLTEFANAFAESTLKDSAERWKAAGEAFTGSTLSNLGGVTGAATKATGALDKTAKAAKGIDLEAADLAEKLRKASDEFDKALATVGMTELGKKVFDLEKAGANAQQIAGVRAKAVAVSVKQAQEEFDKALATAGQTDLQKKLYDLQKDGAKAQDLASLRAKSVQVEIANADAEIQKTLASIGRNEIQKKIFDMRRAGVGEDDIERFQEKSDVLDRLNKQKTLIDELKSKAKEFEEQAGRPLDRYQKKVQALKDAVKDGFLPKDEAAKAYAMLTKEFNRQNKAVRFSGAVEVGSREDRDLLLRSMTGTSNNWQEKLVKQFDGLIGAIRDQTSKVVGKSNRAELSVEGSWA